jgi:ribosomal protein S13
MFEPHLVYLLRKKRYFISKQSLLFIRQVFGIGFYRSRRFLLFCGVNKNYNYKVEGLTKTIMKRMQAKSFKWGFSLGRYLKKRRLSVRIFLQNHKLRRGLRQFYGLPSRGQRSHTNASTCKRARFKFLRIPGGKGNAVKKNKVK